MSIDGLPQPSSGLNLDQFTARLKTSWVGRPFHYFESLHSTNEWAKSHAQILESGTVVFADDQTAGKGQHRRKWLTEPGKNLTFSILLRPGNPQQVHTITITLAAACAEVLQEYIARKVCLKWPNDLYVGNEKLGGILVESSFTGGKIDRLVAGIGINVNQIHFDASLGEVTSVFKEHPGSGICDREQLFARLLGNIEEHLNVWERNPCEARREANRRLIGFGRYGTLMVSEKIREGRFKFMGVNAEGYPVFLSEDADILVFNSEPVRFLPEDDLC